MKTKNILLCSIAMGLVLSGCSEKVQVQQNQEAITQARTMRDYFTKSGGSFSALSPAEQADAMKQVKGTSDDVQKLFDWMKTSNKTAPAGADNMPPHR